MLVSGEGISFGLPDFWGHPIPQIENVYIPYAPWDWNIYLRLLENLSQM